MTENIEKWQDQTAKCIDPRTEAMKKDIQELTPDEVIQYCPDRFFPTIPGTYPERLEPRSQTHSMYADAKIHAALRQLKRDHHMLQATIRYLMLEVGVALIRLEYHEQIDEIDRIIEEIDKIRALDGRIDGVPKFSINQTGGYIKELRSNFTTSDHAMIAEIADGVGLRESSLLVVAFWLFVVKCNRLRDDHIVYGKDIIKQFEDFLQMRIAILNQILAGSAP